MTFVDGIWESDIYTGDYDRPENFFTVAELPALAEKEYDLIVVGAGGAGTAAAVEATDLGASVLVLEKADHAGGSTHYSGGTIRMIADAAGAVEHFFALAQGGTPVEPIEAFVKGLDEIPDWVEAHGGVLIADEYQIARENSEIAQRRVFPAGRVGSAFPDFPHSDSLGLRMHVQPQRPDRRFGAAMWDFLRGALAASGAPVVTGARVTGVLQETPGGAVTGVTVETADGPIQIKSKRGVVLANGGFAWDPEMQRQYFGIDMPAMSPANRNAGDGIRIAQSAGADLWHMTATSTTIGYSVPDAAAAFPCEMTDYGFVLIDQNGRRYARETLMETHSFLHSMLQQHPITGLFDRIPSFIVIDEKTRQAGPLSVAGSLGFNRRYPWSDDNSEEIERGWFESADTIEELAEKLGVPAAALRETIDRYNEHSRAGEDDEFGRPANETLPIDTAPFYGAAVRPTLLNTQGGPRRNERSQVLNPNGEPITGLYAAGELGSIWHRLYPGGGNVSEALVSGRIAATAAVGAVVAADSSR
ncbi:FAD-dependent oxidoreductase [Glaciibacter sp. 2TAF33]|uniref:FAD-dependent oxidoreductase n=1 Tax=Glaciibacter sp. 2TAF33 TaxID=3233015 RepID=UPI003F91E667